MELVAAPQAPCASITRVAGVASTSASWRSSGSLNLRRTQQFLGSKLHIKNLRCPTDFRRRSGSLQVSATKKSYSSFEELLEKSELPVLVDFYATWCGPCQFMVPILGEVQGIMKEEIHVVKIDSEKYTELASKYSIEALPTFILFKDGAPIDRFEGALPANKLIERIRRRLNSVKAGV